MNSLYFQSKLLLILNRGLYVVKISIVPVCVTRPLFPAALTRVLSDSEQHRKGSMRMEPELSLSSQVPCSSQAGQKLDTSPGGNHMASVFGCCHRPGISSKDNFTLPRCWLPFRWYCRIFSNCVCMKLISHMSFQIWLGLHVTTVSWVGERMAELNLSSTNKN